MSWYFEILSGKLRQLAHTRLPFIKISTSKIWPPFCIFANYLSSKHLCEWGKSLTGL